MESSKSRGIESHWEAKLSDEQSKAPETPQQGAAERRIQEQFRGDAHGVQAVTYGSVIESEWLAKECVGLERTQTHEQKNEQKFVSVWNFRSQT